jgi:hypothetical protein
MERSTSSYDDERLLARLIHAHLAGLTQAFLGEADATFSKW